MKLVDKAIEFLKDRKGDEFARKAVILILIVIASVSAADVNATLARMRAAVPEATRAIYERYEQAGLYKDRDRYPDEYQAALDIAYEPVTISVPPPEYLQGMFSKVAYDVYRVMWGEETEF